MPSVGKSVPRIDGHAKVTGRATYAADAAPADAAHAVIRASAIAKGRVLSIDDSAARAVPGVLEVITAANCPRFQVPDPFPAAAGQRRLPLQDDKVAHLGQAIAVVVATSREAAEFAADSLAVRYAPKPATVIPAAQLVARPAASPMHNFRWAAATPAAAAPAAADVLVDQTYLTPFEHHNPMERTAVVAAWQGGTLTLHDGSQWMRGEQAMVAACFGLPVAKVRVVSKFVGGSFGAKRLTWPHVLLAAVAAQRVGRPVVLALTRAQMFSMVGHRPHTEQQLTLRASSDGTLKALTHSAKSTTSMNDNFFEPATSRTRMIYACPSGQVSRSLVRLDLPTPTTMRAPGEATGFFALESAMDELAVALGMDPVALRLKNFATTDPVSGVAWTSNSLRKCYERAGQKFGWAARQPVPGSMRNAQGQRIGWGMASAAYPVNRSPASASVSMDATGMLTVRSGTHEMGGGICTALAQIATDAVGTDLDHVKVEIGDTALPRTTVSGGSRTLASVGSAVLAASRDLRGKLLAAAAAQPGTVLTGKPVDTMAAGGGRVFLTASPAQGVGFNAIVAAGGAALDASANAAPPATAPGPMLSFGAHFVEVVVDTDVPVPRVSRVVSAFGVGQVVNPLLVRSQLAGGIVGGIGMALLEESVSDPVAGGFVNASLLSYLVPTCADVPAIDVILVKEVDDKANPLGSKGVGELGIVGIAAAIANAVYHATGVRVRRLPIQLDTLLH
ncbi:xanthine dehydrogenase family protein molybdopterin-binding subunit [Cupriavidus necator]|uniref:xanthine dehydrogenase family protein molybdopterin-binding subunit n=1 Tax=Cupriavidus necator TaxID=106590 RepID=UPI0005B338E9|nr:xanthine dehydrogenase family protein molybdopterin-binding subunit [Cupriavidus necator]